MIQGTSNVWNDISDPPSPSLAWPHLPVCRLLILHRWVVPSCVDLPDLGKFTHNAYMYNLNFICSIYHCYFHSNNHIKVVPSTFLQVLHLIRPDIVDILHSTNPWNVFCISWILYYLKLANTPGGKQCQFGLLRVSLLSHFVALKIFEAMVALCSFQKYLFLIYLV